MVIHGQKKFYNRCDLILVPTDLIKNELIEYGFDKSKLVLWQRGIDHTIFNRSKKVDGFSQRMFGNNHPVILYASRMVWEKNLHILPKLYEHFQINDIPINFLMVGDGVAKNELEKRMPNAKFTGEVDHPTLSLFYASADVFIFPSISETYGNVVVEAMACGLPCVIGNGGGSSSLIKQGINGFKCNPEDVSDFFKKINLIIKSTSIRSQIISAGLKYVHPLEWNKLVMRYFGYLDFLIGKSYQYA
jgi:glycosyltransferase involved in cell wall biosynthesis